MLCACLSPCYGKIRINRHLFNSNIYRAEREIASAFYLIPFVSFKFDFFYYAMCNVPDYVLLSCFNISKDNIRIAIATYFYSSPKWLYLFCFYCTFAI